MADLDAVTTALADLKDADAKALIQDALDAGTPATNILAACQAALAEVGARFETGEYFISELMFAGEVMKEIMAGLAPHLGGAAPATAWSTSASTSRPRHSSTRSASTAPPWSP